MRRCNFMIASSIVFFSKVLPKYFWPKRGLDKEFRTFLLVESSGEWVESVMLDFLFWLPEVLRFCIGITERIFLTTFRSYIGVFYEASFVSPPWD